jgi:hypothetical protein
MKVMTICQPSQIRLDPVVSITKTSSEPVPASPHVCAAREGDGRKIYGKRSTQ